MKKCFLIFLGISLVVGFIICSCTQPAIAAEKGKYGGIIKFNFAKAAHRFGVPWNVRHWNHVYNTFCCDTLVQGTDEQGVFNPMLATRWELAPDKSYYRFYLRKGVKFHDGTDFNAHAAKWNLDKWIPIKEAVLQNMSSVEVIDDYTIQCNLSEWDSLTLSDFTRRATIISPTAYEKNGEEWMNSNPIGTGPFKIKAYKRDNYVKYDRNNNYWIKRLPYVDGIEIYNIPDPMTAIAALKKGDVIALNEVDPVTADELRKTGKYSVDYIPALSQVIVMNSTSPKSIWYDKRMREALEYAVDKETIVKALGRGFMHPVNEIIKYCPGNPKKTIRKYNPERAKQLLKESGYPNGVKVKLSVMAEAPQETNIALQECLAKVGIQVELKKVRGATWNQLSFKPSPGNDLRIELQRGSPGNVLRGVKDELSGKSLYLPGLKRPKGFNELLDKTLKSTDNNEVISLLEKMEELAYEDVMFVPLWNWPIICVYSPNLKDAEWFFGRTPTVRLDKAYFAKK